MKIIRNANRFFCGFLYVHPGSQPQGKMVPSFDSVRAIVIPNSDLKSTLAEIRGYGIEELEVLDVIRKYQKR